ncbi:acyltransferase family protein [Paraburkholderia sp. BCC1884]|uniref:acyltransferase family protein n=1 Tax=Paraburkholderia sp. BCC1884 TaxID=2562668 RepID=UPI001642930A|nr:acyltransferase [Paraburkholderia sp. BCC1884]
MPHRSNNFDALRLLGALLVAVGHTYDVFVGGDPLADATGNQSFGGVGLNIFCVISGFLITKSRNNNDTSGFFRSRILRIFPALLVSVPIMALLIGPMMSSLPVKEYFASGATWRFLGSMLVFPLNSTLPGVFGGAPLIGQLYSLTAELSFYAFVGWLGTRLDYSKLLTVLTALLFAAFVHFDYSTLSFSSLITLKVGQLIVFMFPVRLGLICVFYLFAGSMIATFLKDVTRLTQVTPILMAVWLIALLNSDRRVYDIVEMVAFPIIVIGIGSMSRFTVRIPGAIGDLSYGIYIWHFLVAELLITLIGRRPVARGWIDVQIVASILVSCGVAFVSFHLVERRALAMKRRTSAAGDAARLARGQPEVR